MQQLLFSKDYAVGTKLFLISQLNLNLLQINSVVIILRGVIGQRISVFFSNGHTNTMMVLPGDQHRKCSTTEVLSFFSRKNQLML